MAEVEDTTGDAGTADAAVAVDAASTEATEWTPPTQQDWDNVQLALKKARQDARQAKRGAKEPVEGSEGAPDLVKATADATAAAEARYKPIVVKSAARAAFAEAGLVIQADKPDAAMARAIRLLDLADIDVTEDGTVDGLAEQVAEIKAEFPELFAPKAPRTARRVDGADKGNVTNGKPKTSAEVMAALINGG